MIKFSELVNREDFKSLPYEERFKFLEKHFPEVAALPSEERGRMIGKYQTKGPSAQDRYSENLGEGLVELVKGIPGMAVAAGKAIGGPSQLLPEMMIESARRGAEVAEKVAPTFKADPTLGVMEGAGRIASQMFPLTEKAGEQFGRGDYAGGAGTATAALLSAFVPAGVRGISRLSRTPINPPAAARRPVQTGSPRPAPSTGVLAGEGLQGPREPAGVPMSFPEKVVTKVEHLETEAAVPPENVGPVKYAKEKGIPVTVGQATGSERWQAAESTASVLTDELIAKQREAVNLLKGEAEKKAGKLTPLSTKVEHGQKIQGDVNKQYREIKLAEDNSWDQFWGAAESPNFSVKMQTGTTPVREVPVTATGASAARGGRPQFGRSEFGDLIDVVMDIGRLKPPKKGVVTGEYDAWGETMNTPKARLLVDEKNGMAPDEMRQTLAEAGFEFGDTSEMLHAINHAIETRPTMKVQAGKIMEGGDPIIETVKGPVNLPGVKKALAPIVAQIEKELPASLLEKSPGYQLLKQILDRPDVLDIRTASADVSALKNIARGRGAEQEFPQVVSKSRALAKIAVKEYQAAINKTVDSMGPEVRAMYDRANKATIKRTDFEKFQRNIVRIKDGAEVEPTSVIDQFTRDRDNSYNRLLALKARSPQSMDTVAGAVISEAIARATEKGGGFSPRIFSTQLSKIGPKTMETLFGAEGAAEIQNMAGVGRMLGQEFNPSRTGKMNTYLKYLDGIMDWGVGIGGIVGAVTTHGFTGTAVGGALGQGAKLLVAQGKSQLLLARARLIAKMAYDPKFKSLVQFAEKAPEGAIKTQLEGKILRDPVVRSVQNDLDKSSKGENASPEAINGPESKQSGQSAILPTGTESTGRQGLSGPSSGAGEGQRGSAEAGESVRSHAGGTSSGLKQFIIDQKTGNPKRLTGTYGSGDTVLDQAGNVINRGSASGAVLEMGKLRVRSYGDKL